MTPSDGLFEPDHELFREAARAFVARHVEPHIRRWDDEQHIDRGLWRLAAEAGLLGITGPEEHGGGGSDDWRYRCVVTEELARVGASSVNVALGGMEDLVAPYLVDLGTQAQQERWLRALYCGAATSAIAMTEPGAGSDLRAMRTTARRSGSAWILNGSKTFITGGATADFAIVVARAPSPDASDDRDHRRDPFTLFVVERGMRGFVQGRPYDSIGQRGDTVADLAFDDVELGDEHVLGEVGGGFAHLMERLPRERMSIAYYALAASETALRWTLEEVAARPAFGRRISDFQATRFALGELDTEIRVTRAFVDRCVLQLNASTLTPEDAARAKWWTTELLQRVVSRCVQLHGGAGYMRETPIARLFLDARVHTIYGGTTEIMKEVISRELLGPAR